MMDVSKLQAILENDGIVFLSYGGFLTQSLIVGMTEALEKETETAAINMKTANNIYTIFIELSQNMMTYSLSPEEGEQRSDANGLILVGKQQDDSYYLLSQNVMGLEGKEKLEKKLQGILETDLAGIKKLYREARRSGKDTHSKGGGIGFYEIAKRCRSIEFDFKPLNNDKFTFKFKANI